MKVKSIILIALFAAVAIVAAVAFKDAPSTAVEPSDSTAASTQNTQAESDLSSLTKVMVPAGADYTPLSYEGFDVAFSPSHHQPAYVAWVLTPDHTDGPFSRKDVDFASDPSVSGCASLADYKGSGYDRGHMAPAADMKWSLKAMQHCHYLTNMCPQDNALNSGAWATVEKNTRKWASKYGALVIIAGPVLTDVMPRTIGSSHIPVPERFFKVILAPQANPPMGIAFIMPNSKVEGGAQSTTATIDQIEAITGYDFFSALPDDIETQLEAHSALHEWNR